MKDGIKNIELKEIRVKVCRLNFYSYLIYNE